MADSLVSTLKSWLRSQTTVVRTNMGAAPSDPLVAKTARSSTMQAGASRIVPGPFDEQETYMSSFPRDFTSIIFDNPESQMELQERLALYTMTLCLRPRNVLEVGVCDGGSSRIMVRALDDNNRGRLYSIDPEPRVKPELLDSLKHRMTLLTGYSPDGVTELRSLAGDGFDLALIDGDHTYDGVVRDIRGVLQYLADTAYLVFHDSYNHPVRTAIDDCVRENTRQLQDCGLFCRDSVWEPDRSARWGGIRMVVFSRHGFDATHLHAPTT